MSVSDTRIQALPNVVAAEPDFAVYVHWPFCAQKCPYCDFNSHVRHGGWDEARFLSAYLAELDWTAALMTGEPGPPSASWRRVGEGEGRQTPAVTSVFFGGGTPSLMQPETVAAIIAHIDALWGLADGAEITLEANPGSVEAGRFRGYAAAGVTRVSLGLQSLRDDELRRLGRIHTVAEAKTAVAIAQTHFARSSFDLIYARPGQTPAQWRAELGEALAFAAGHLSLYQLTIEPETPFAMLHAAGKLVVPDGDTALALYDMTQEMCAGAGLPAYEISNHARPGEESRHNLTYWRYGSYVGVGPGAHGRLIAGAERLATATEKNPEAWAARVEARGHGLVEQQRLSRSEAADEMLLMGLRLGEGVHLERLARVGGARPAEGTIDELVGLGLIARLSGDRIAATGAGRFILNELVMRLSQSFEPHDPRPIAAV